MSDTDNEPHTADGDGDGIQTVNESGDATNLDIALTETEIEESMAVDDNEEAQDETETPVSKETHRDSEEDKTDDFVLTGDLFETDILDDGGMDDEGDDEDGKEIHEGDGEHEDIKEENMEEDEEEEEEDDSHGQINQDPNVLPQVNVAVLAQRTWQVKVYPLKPSDFTNGQISRVFKHARESLLYLQSPGKNCKGKGEMYLSSANQAVRCVLSLMRLEFFYPEINVEIMRKNEEGAVEERAYLRFDSKLTQILTMRPFRRGPGGRKRDRMIGSVFLKNLPAGTTKDTLRVMFPFAQEINYNPEKFKECTARLVLPYRSHVIPCLKAFAKVELGGNVLELYPLTKRKRTRTDEDNDASDAKQRKKSDEPKEEKSAKSTEENKSDTKKPPVKKNVANRDASKNTKERFTIKTGPPKDRKPDEKNKKPPQKPLSQNRPGSRFAHLRKDQRSDNNQNRPKLVDGKERSSHSFTAPSSQSGKPAGRGGRGGNANRPRQDRSPASSVRSFRSERSNRDNRSTSSRASGNRNSRPGGVSADRGGRQPQSNFGRSGYSGTGAVGGFGVGAGAMSASDASLAASAEATKEMMLLQNQLGMAIKNQLAMLNQTTMAVEQAKRGLGTAADLQSTSSLLSRTSSQTGLGARAGPSRRSVDQYRPGDSMDNSGDRYIERKRERPKAIANRQGYNQRRGSGRGKGAGSGGYNRQATTSYRNDVDDWDSRSAQSSQYQDPYTTEQDYSYDGNVSSFGSSSRTGYDYNQDGDYSGYY